MNGLLHAHSGLRYVVLILLLLAITKAWKGWKNKEEYTASNDKINLFAMISLHIQLLIGLALYFINDWYKIDGDVMANSASRFFAVEHIFGMIVAVTLITMGRAKSKKLTIGEEKHKKIAVFYLIGLIIIFISIPWPFMPAPRGFF